jgi:hypothetical protein
MVYDDFKITSFFVVFVLLRFEKEIQSNKSSSGTFHNKIYNLYDYLFILKIK